jgi:hypothetical protein
MHGLFTNPPWWIKIPAGLLALMLGTFPHILPDAVEPFARPVAGALAAWLIIAASWHSANLHRRKHEKPDLKLEPIYIIILGLVIALGGVVWQWQRASSPDGKIAQLESQISSLTKALDNARNTPATQATPQQSLGIPHPPKREYSSEEKRNLKGLMMVLSGLLNRNADEIRTKLQSYVSDKDDNNQMSAKDSFDTIKEVQDKTTALYNQIFQEIIPKNKYFERELNWLVGLDWRNPRDLKSNVLYQLRQQLGPLHGQLNMALVLIQKMKDDGNESTERQILQLAEEPLWRRAAEANSEFGMWINKSNERIDEETRDLQ